MLEGVQYVTGEEWRAITNSCRKNEVAGPKQKQRSVVGVSGGESKVQCCKKQCCVGTWNIRSMNQDKLDVVKQKMVRANIRILVISVVKWMGVGDFNLDDCIYYCEQECLRRNGIAFIVNKTV